MCNKKKKGNKLFGWLTKTAVCLITAFTIAIAPVVTPMMALAQENPGNEIAPEATTVESPATTIDDATAVEDSITDPVAEEVGDDQTTSAPGDNIQNDQGENPGGNGSQNEGLIGCNPDPDPNPEVPCGENAIINGDFEQPIVVTPQKWNIYDSYAPGLNWTAKWVGGSSFYQGHWRPFTAKVELQAGYSDWLAAKGNQYAELDTDWDGPGGSLNGEPASIRIYQDLTTIPDKEYQVSFYFSPRPGTSIEDNILEFSWGGIVIDTISEAGGSNVNWTLHTYILTATNAVTRVQFADLGNPNSLGTFLDDVVAYEICDELPEPCTNGPGWANEVTDSHQGTRKDGSAVNADRSDPTSALNAPDDKFFSLGVKGTLTASFEGYVQNIQGDDLSFHETTYGRSSYPEESALIEVSQDNATWYAIGTAGNHNGGDGVSYFSFDSTGLSWIKYVRLTDTTNFDPHSSDADGYDVNAIDATNIICDEDITTVIAHKIVCDLEAELPNWGTGGPDITATTAEDWVASHKSCHFVPGWDFQWGPQSAYDPGDTLVGPANEPWKTMPPTDTNGMTTVKLTSEDIGGSYLWFREELKEGYIPFTFGQNGDTNVDPVSAELYCHIDVLNYDNYDRVDGIEPGKTYNCIGFNVLSEVPVRTVSGMKFNDKDGDGAKDEGESGLAEWTIYASKLVQTIQVEAKNDISTSPEFWTNELTDGKEYILRASGTYDANDYITADAKYSMRSIDGTDWTDSVKNYLTYGPTLLDLFVDDDVVPNWGVYNPSHIYWRTIIGTGAKVKLQIYEIYAQNDSGALTVDVYEVIDKQITDGDGNYHFTFPNDIGEVIISEQTQDGWLETMPAPEGYYIVSTGSNYVDKDFGNYYATQQPTGSVTGIKFSDRNRNHQKDEGEEGLEGWRIGAVKGIETLFVDAHGEVTGTPISTSFNSVAGREYFFRASGTFNAGDLITADAKYSVREPNTIWTDIVQNYEIYGPTLLDLHINGLAPNWGGGIYNGINHAYWYNMLGDGNPFVFQIRDIYAYNNVGQLKVQIWEVLAADTTDENGNYALDLTDIDGKVVIAEERQRGWIQTYPYPTTYYVVSTDVDSTGLDFGNYNTAGNDDGGGFDLVDAQGNATPINSVNDDGNNGGGGGGGGGNNPPRDEVLGDQDNTGGSGGGATDETVLGERSLVAAGSNLSTLLLVMLLLGLSMSVLSCKPKKRISVEK